MSEDWGAQYARLRQIIKGAHGALTDAGSVVVPGTLEGHLAPAIRQLTRERDEARNALAEWRKHDSAPDCVACAVLDAATCGALRVEDLLDGLPRCACGIPGPEKERECHADYYDGETFAIDSGGEYGPTNVCKCGCHRPRLSTEAEAKAAMGDGQPLVKMREVKP